MATARSVSTASFIRQFEEVALIRQSTAAEMFFGLLSSGSFEVSYNSASDWWISDVYLILENFKFGPDGRTHAYKLDADTDERLYLVVLDALEDRFEESIQEQIEEELADAGIGRPRYAA